MGCDNVYSLAFQSRVRIKMDRFFLGSWRSPVLPSIPYLSVWVFFLVSRVFASHHSYQPLCWLAPSNGQRPDWRGRSCADTPAHICIRCLHWCPVLPPPRFPISTTAKNMLDRPFPQFFRILAIITWNGVSSLQFVPIWYHSLSLKNHTIHYAKRRQNWQIICAYWTILAKYKHKKRPDKIRPILVGWCAITDSNRGPND